MFGLFEFLKDRQLHRERILALDLLRGTFLIVIVTSHIAWNPSLFTFVGGGSKLPASAGEAFFVISGLLVGYLYAPKVLKETKKVFKKIWKRAALLYFLATFFTFFYTAWAVLEPQSHLTLYAREPWRFLVDTLTLRYAFGWAGYLNLYALFMLVAPFAVWLVAKGKGLLVIAASVAIWFFLREELRLAPFAAWQLLFMCALVIGYYLPQLEAWYRHLPKRLRLSLFGSICGVAIITYLASIVLFVAAPLVATPDSPLLRLNAELGQYLDKTHLAPARVAIGTVWFAALYMIFRRFERAISRGTRGVLEVFGKQSLFVYCLHAFILFFIDLYFQPPLPNLIIQNTVVTFAVLALIYFAASYRARATKYGKRLLRNKNTTAVP